MLKITSKGIPELQRRLKSLASDIKDVATRAVAEYLVGDRTHGLKHYPEYRHVPYSRIGGFVSARQRRYVMARIREGTIDPGAPHRTGNYQRGWQAINEGVKTQIVNSVPYAQYVGGDETQARLNKKVGWRTVSAIISTNVAGAIRHAEAAINKIVKGEK